MDEPPLRRATRKAKDITHSITQSISEEYRLHEEDGSHPSGKVYEGDKPPENYFVLT